MAEQFWAPIPDKRRGIETTHMTAITAAFVFLIDVAHLPAEARVECRPNADIHSQEFIIQRNPGEPEHTIRFGNVSDSSSTGEPPFDAPTKLFLDITHREERFSWINYSVENPEALKTFLIPLINDAKQELHLSWSALSEISPRDLISMSSWIVSKKLLYDSRLGDITDDGKKNPHYDSALAQQVAAQPFDVKIMKGGIGVCRDFTSEITFLSKTIKDIARSKACEFVHVADLESRYDRHGLNVIFELKNENGKPVIFIYYVGVSGPVDYEKGQAFVVDLFDRLEGPYQKISPTADTYLAPVLSEEDARVLLKCIIDYREQGVLNFSVLTAIFQSYGNSIGALEQRADHRAAKALEKERRAYYRLMLPYVNQALEKGGYGDDPYQRIMALQMLELFYRGLREDELRFAVLEKLHSEVGWNFVLQKLTFNDMYADQLGENGNTQRALEVYEELFVGFQKQEPEKKIVFKKKIFENHKAIELEPFASRDQFDRYMSYKKQGWEKTAPTSETLPK